MHLTTKNSFGLLNDAQDIASAALNCFSWICNTLLRFVTITGEKAGFRSFR